MRGQTSYITKPMILVFMIVLLLYLAFSLYMSGGEQKEAGKRLDMMDTATNTLLMLANSKDCLAYEVPVTQGALANIVEAEKLYEFSEKYAEIEPECARSYDFGFRVFVSEVINEYGDIGRTWSFGASEFSTGSALRDKYMLWMPVAIRHSKKQVRIGRMELHIYDGELEKIAGFLDWACTMGMLGRGDRFSSQVYTSYPVHFNSTHICLWKKEKVCRRLVCNITSFQNLGSPGTYMLTTGFESPDRLSIKI